MKTGEAFNPYGMFYGCIIPNCIMKLNITGTAKLCWGRLAQYGGKNGKIYPKQETLATELGVSKSSIIRAIQELEENNLIKRILPVHIHMNNQYVFLWHKCMEDPGFDEVECQNDTPMKCQNDTPMKCQNDTPYKYNHKDQIKSSVKYSSNEEYIANPNGFAQPDQQIKSRKRLLVKHLSSNTEEENSATTLKPSPLVQEIFDYWMEHGLRMPKKGTKSYNKCVVNTRGLLGGKILGEKYDINQIKTAIDYFSFAALDADFEPADLSMKKSLARTTIDSFIFNQFRQNGNSSLFKKYLTNPPKALKEKIISEDKYPRITKRLMRYYRDEVLGGVGTTFSNKEENLFRVASVKLKEFYNKHKSRFNKFINVTDPQLAQWLWESIKGDCRGDDLSKISPGWFSSNNTFTRRLPAYLFRQAVIESRTETYQGLQATHETDFWFDN